MLMQRTLSNPRKRKKIGGQLASSSPRLLIFAQCYYLFILFAARIERCRSRMMCSRNLIWIFFFPVPQPRVVSRDRGLLFSPHTVTT